MMRLSISNIAWSEEYDNLMYSLMKELKFEGLEIAPTRVFNSNPYEKKDEAFFWSKELFEKYGLHISSIQSIWYGRRERLFEDSIQRKILLDYTFRAIEFAEIISCGNLVFGSPKNRCIFCNDDYNEGVKFFSALGEYAQEHKTVIGIEANPTIYGTNYIVTTKEALELIIKINNPSIKLNLDLGCMIANNESIDVIKGFVKHINHIHISEPNLVAINKRDMHKKIIKILTDEGYDKYISVEMKSGESINSITMIMEYLKGLFE